MFLQFHEILKYIWNFVKLQHCGLLFKLQAELKALANQGIFLTDENLMETTTEAALALQVWVAFFSYFDFSRKTLNFKSFLHDKR